MGVLGEHSYPFLDDDGQTRIMDPDTGQKYEVDPNTGGALLPGGGVDYPDWAFGKPQGQPQGQPDMGIRPRGTQPGITPYQPNVPTNLPAYNMQPGMPAQQWEGTYTLGVAGEKRLRDTLEQSTIPQARAGIDQMLSGIQQQRFGNQMGVNQAQTQNTGMIPRYMPKPPTFQPGGWQQYGGAQPGQPGTQPVAVNEDVAAQAIWQGNPQLQSMYQQNHPEMTPLQAVQDWWSWAPHEGANSIPEYAQMKGYLKGA